MSLRSLSLRNALTVAVCAAILAGCPSGSDVTDPAPEADGGLGEGGTLPDGAVPVACGRLTTLCGDGAKCAGSADCTSQLCTGGACAAVVPADGVKNGDETDVDCGGTKAPACVDAKGCALASDCKSGVCTNKICQAPTSTDGVQNGNETGVDCGGTSTGAPKCPTGTGCLVDGDCANVKCDTVQKKCASASHSDGLKNDGETGVDCGGPSPTKCATGEGCASNADCNAVACDAAGTKLCLAATHSDGITNLGETGVDCGGAAPTKCATGQGCLATTDCNKALCDVAGTKLCLAPSHTDGILNLGETGIDCGGAALPLTCGPGQGCAVLADCTNTKCNAGTLVCDPPSKTDGIKNGTETDVDCGGGAPTNAGPCAVGQACGADDANCLSNVCNYASTCVAAPSCRVQNGGDTCGAAGANESCCGSVTLPGSAVKIDKYEITAGRMREFIRAVSNNVQAWVVLHPTAQIPAALVPFLPTGLDTPSQMVSECNDPSGDFKNCSTNASKYSTVNQNFGVRQYLGNNVFMGDRPCPGCGQGCYIGSGVGGNGHPTYWWDDTTQTMQFGSAKRSIAFGAAAQSILDAKSLNCTPQVLFAAFCAWDGGRLPTQPELGGVSGAWGPTAQPWGDSPDFHDTVNGAADPNRVQYGFANIQSPCAGGTPCFVVPMFNGNLAAPALNPAAMVLNTTNFNPFPSSPDAFESRYMNPIPLDYAGFGNNTQVDQAWAIAEPGRMRNDFRFVGPGPTDGYYDVMANLIEVTATGTGNDDANHNSWPRVSWVGGSFEGHNPANRAGYNLSVFTKYGKQGARCAR